VFPGLPGGFATEPIATIEGTQANSWLGRHFGRGDVSCDGIDDWIVSEHGWDGPLGLNQGRLLVFEGPIQSAILTTGATWIFEGEAPFTLSPYGLNPHAGDVDGDGCDDLLVGEHLHDGAAVNTGRAVLYLGSPGGPVPSGWIYSGTAGGEQAGFAVDFVGDVNGDGYDDLAVGVPRRAADAGAVLVFHGGPLGPSAQPAVTIDGAAAEQLGRGVAAGGDVNGDGWNDLLVGAPYADGARGRVALHLGGPSGVSVEPAWEAFGTRPDGYLGGALATADVDGDGTPDVLVGPVGLEGLEVNASAYLFSGPPRAGAALRVYPEIAAAGVPLSLDISMDGARGPCTCTIEWGGETDVVDGCDPSTLGAVQRVFAPGAHPVRVTLVDAFGLRSEALATIEAR